MASTALRPASPTTYTRLLQLGAGGMGEVYLALSRRQPDFQRLVVIKTIRQRSRDSKYATKMLTEEARICARLNHPNVVQVTEIVELDDGIMLVMEYLDGLCLSDAYRAAGEAFTLPLRIRAICEALAGLHYAHELADYSGRPFGIIHRDVSPENIFLTYDGRIKLLDFGVAKADDAPQSTSTGVVKGRISYMSIEQIRGQTVDRRTDIFAMGCILYEAVCQRRLWKGYSPGEIAVALSAGDTPSLDRALRIDPPLAAIIERAMAHDRSERFATAEEMRLALESYLHSQTKDQQVLARDIGDMLARACVERRERTKREIAEAVQRIERGRSEAPTPLVPPSSDVPSVVLPRAARVPDELGDEERSETSKRSALGPSSRSASGTLASHLATPSGTGTGLRKKTLVSPGQGSKSNSNRALYGFSLLLFAIAALVLIFSGAFSGQEAQNALIVEAIPATAVIHVDGQPGGVGRSDLMVKAGSTHTIRVEQPGYVPVERSVTSLQESTVVPIRLAPLPVPAGAPVENDAASVAAPETTQRTPPLAAEKSSVTPRFPRARPRAAPSPTGSVPSSARAPSSPQPTSNKNCNPPYYFKGGIKTYKPECI